KLGELIGRVQPGMVEPGEPWADAVLRDVQEMDPAAQAAWKALLAHAATATPARPTRTWLREARPLVEAVGRAELERRALGWLGLIAEQAAGPLPERNTDIAKGLVWACRFLDGEAVCRAIADLAAACFKMDRWGELRSQRLGNACLWTLGELPGT